MRPDGERGGNDNNSWYSAEKRLQGLLRGLRLLKITRVRQAVIIIGGYEQGTEFYRGQRWKR